MTRRVMLDLETLDTNPTAVVVSIGACFFGPEGPTPDTFYEVLKLPEQVEAGRTVNPSTVAWWLQQSEDARRAVYQEPRADVDWALAKFAQFVNSSEGEVEMWGYGADFDCVVLGGLYTAMGMKRPWSYNKNRCHRTLVNLAKGFVEVPPRTGTHHNALDDALYQATCAGIYLKRLGVK